MNIKILILILSLSASMAYAQVPRVFTLSADEWAQPRSGQVLASFSSVSQAVDYWQKNNNAIFLIRYPGEDSGELWAAELRDWMVSLGVPNDAISLASGLENLDEIAIVVAQPEELNF